MLDEVNRERIENELKAAEAALSEGLTGRSRVCARRAAGIVIQAYLKGKNLPHPGNVLDSIRLFASQAEITPRMKQIADHLILQVDEAFQLPQSVNLIKEVRELVDGLDQIER